MTTYPIQGPARLCAASGRELKPGEKIVSVLLEEAGALVRKDYARDAWSEPPTDAIAYWSGSIPTAERPTKPVINDALLLDCFEHLSEAADDKQKRFRYVVALLLMRRKRLKFEDARKSGDEETLILRDAKTGTRHEVVDPKLTDAEMASVQEEVFRVLDWQ